jgi:hypothetical protein
VAELFSRWQSSKTRGRWDRDDWIKAATWRRRRATVAVVFSRRWSPATAVTATGSAAAANGLFLSNLASDTMFFKKATFDRSLQDIF